MPISFNCPGCGQLYKVPDEVAGRSTKCRKCAALMQIPLASETAEPEPVVAIQEAPAAPAPAAFSEAAAAPAAPGWKDRAQQFGDQAGPMVNSLRRASPKVLIPIAAGILVVFCLLPTFLIARWLFGGGNTLGNGERYLPDNAKIVASVWIEKLADSPLFKELQKEFPELREEVAPPGSREKAKRMLFAGGYNDDVPVIVTELNATATIDEAKKLFKATKLTEEKYGEFTLQCYSDGLHSLAFCFPEKYILLQGQIDQVKAILKRNKKPDMSADMQRVLKETDLSATVTVVALLKGAPLENGPGVEQIRKFADKLDYSVIQINVGSDLDMKAVIHCTEEQAAKDLSDMMQGFLTMAKTFAQLPKDATELINAIKIERKGMDMLITMKLNQDTIVKGTKQLKKL